MGLREEHRALTTRTIIDAVLDLVADGTIDALSIPAVAERSGVSVATIYRYFKTKDELLAAAAAEPARKALAAIDPDVAAAGDYATIHAALWREFATNMPLLRHQVVSAAGREMRTIRLDTSRRQLAPVLAARGVDPDSAEGRRLISLLMLVSGSLALVELHDRQGLDLDDALEASRWAVEALIDATAAAAPPTTTRRSTNTRRSR